MTGIIITQQQSGESIPEQKCYLQHAGDNQAIMDCLDKYEHDTCMGGMIIIGLALVVAYFVSRM